MSHSPFNDDGGMGKVDHDGNSMYTFTGSINKNYRGPGYAAIKSAQDAADAANAHNTSAPSKINPPSAHEMYESLRGLPPKEAIGWLVLVNFGPWILMASLIGIIALWVYFDDAILISQKKLTQSFHQLHFQ